MTMLIGAPVNGLRTGQITLLFEDHAQPEPTEGFGAAIRDLRTGLVAPVFQQHSEVVSTGGVAALVRAAVRRLCTN
jgi:hypothetical protein